jgi:hypothetical protein
MVRPLVGRILHWVAIRPLEELSRARAETARRRAAPRIGVAPPPLVAMVPRLAEPSAKGGVVLVALRQVAQAPAAPPRRAGLRISVAAPRVAKPLEAQQREVQVLLVARRPAVPLRVAPQPEGQAPPPRVGRAPAPGEIRHRPFRHGSMKAGTLSSVPTSRIDRRGSSTTQ